MSNPMDPDHQQAEAHLPKSILDFFEIASLPDPSATPLGSFTVKASTPIFDMEGGSVVYVRENGDGYTCHHFLPNREGPQFFQPDLFKYQAPSRRAIYEIFHNLAWSLLEHFAFSRRDRAKTEIHQGPPPTDKPLFDFTRQLSGEGIFHPPKTTHVYPCVIGIEKERIGLLLRRGLPFKGEVAQAVWSSRLKVYDVPLLSAQQERAS